MYSKMIITITLLFFTANLAGQSMDRQKRFDEFKEKLELTEEQIEQFKILYKENADKKNKSDLEDPRRDRQEIAEIDKKIRNILTPQQYEKYIEIIISRAVEKQLTVIEIKVGLNNQQLNSVREIVLDGLKELRMIKNETSRGQERLQQVRVVYQKMDSQILVILDADQKDKYEIYKEERRQRFRGRDSF